jgi:hypothetical protein
MNWRMRMSFRLLGTAHKKNNPVTRKNGNNCPVGRKDFSDDGVRLPLAAAPVSDTDICFSSRLVRARPGAADALLIRLLLHKVKCEFHDLQIIN